MIYFHISYTYLILFTLFIDRLMFAHRYYSAHLGCADLGDVDKQVQDPSMEVSVSSAKTKRSEKLTGGWIQCGLV